MADNEQVEQKFAVQRIYTKDASLETPMGIEAFGKQWQPSINVDMNSKVNKVSDEQYEVVLTFTVTVKLEDQAAMLIEVHQAGLFLVQGLEGDALRQALGIFGPNLLFPYVRETVDNLAVRGGFPAIGLQPINFEALYVQAQKKAAEQKAAAEPH